MSAATATRPHHSLVAILVIVLAVAVILRSAFALIVTTSLTADAFRDIHGDTNGYAKLGQNIAEGDAYAIAFIGPRNKGFLASGESYNRAIHRGRLRALARPPGYPFFLALHKWGGVSLDGDLRPIVWSQIVFSSLTAGIVGLLAYIILGHRAAALLAGLFAACSPTAIASASLLTPDCVYAFCTTAGFGAFLICATRAVGNGPRILWSVIAGVFFAASVALKPAILYWPALAIPLLLIIRGRGWQSFRDAGLAFLPMVLFVGFWTAQNYQREGIATYSTIATRNLRYDVVIRADLIEQFGRFPSEERYERTSKLVMLDDNELLKSRSPDLLAMHQSMGDEIRRCFLSQPMNVAKVLLANLSEQTTTGWLWIDKQIPQRISGSKAIYRAFRLTSRDGPIIAWFLGIFAAIPICLMRKDQRAVMPLTNCLLGYLYLAAGTATIHGEGSRLLTAGEPLCLLLITATLCHGVEVLRRIRTGG